MRALALLILSVLMAHGQYAPPIGGSGGSGTPASPTNSIQFNNAGSFGGSANLTWDGSTLAIGTKLSVGSGSSRLSALTAQPGTSAVISGTTTANATANIVGVGTHFLTEVGLGDILSLSSNPSNLGTVTLITDDTHLTLDSAYWGDSLGNGTSQTITVRPSVVAWRDSTGYAWSIVNANGQSSFGNGGLYSNGVGSSAVPVPNAYSWINLSLPADKYAYADWEVGSGSANIARIFNLDASDTNVSSSATGAIPIDSYARGSGTKRSSYVFGFRAFGISNAGGSNLLWPVVGQVGINSDGPVVEASPVYASLGADSGATIATHRAGFIAADFVEGGSARGPGRDFTYYGYGGTFHTQTGGAAYPGVEIQRYTGQSAPLLQFLDNDAVVGSTTFTGAGLNDGTFAAFTATHDQGDPYYTGITTQTFCAIIDGTGTPNTFKWGTNAGCDNGATAVPIDSTGAYDLAVGETALLDSISITFSASTGHTLADKWSMTATPRSVLGGFTSDARLSNRSVAFSALGTPANGEQVYCSDCQVTTVAANVVSNATCKDSGSGAWALRVGGAWKCTYTP